jgi:hypothetical protein
VESDPPNLAPEAREQEIERLAQELGRLIQDSQEKGSAPAPFNPLGTGVLIFCLGAGLSFVFGPIGLLLMLGGMIFIIWGALISWIKG